MSRCLNVSFLVLLVAAPAGAQSLLKDDTAFTKTPAALPTVVHPGGQPERDGASTWRARDGHFHFSAQVNGAMLPFLFDSGASRVALRYEEAAKAGIDVGALHFDVPVGTANGRAMAAAVLIQELSVGGITRTQVPALVGKPGALSQNLLGQSFLAQLGGFRQDGDQLVLLNRR